MDEAKKVAREASRAMLIFWTVFGVFVAAWGALQMIRPEGNKFFGLIALVGFSFMVAREHWLHHKWKKNNSKK